MKTRLAFMLMGLVTWCNGQSIEKHAFAEGNAKDYYLTLRPATPEIKGVLVLLPGFGQAPESIFPESKLFNVAYANSLLVMAVAGGEKLYADEVVVARLTKALEHLRKKFPVIRADQFVIGGYSAGGTIALRYAEYCGERPGDFPIAPRGVFSVDSPVDLFDIWEYFQREARKNYSEVGANEARFVTEIMAREIGTPSTHAARYQQLSPFNHAKKEPGNEKFLMKTAVRLYEDTDVVWQLTERRRSIFDNNMLAASELINRLLLAGNAQAEFMAARQPGVRSSGLRHPHSWSIVDEVELVQWALRILK